MVFTSLEQLIGNTPLLALEKLTKALGLDAKLYAKLEGMNPAGSIKDRAALSMVLAAEEKGLLRPGATIIEPTSGNTGIGLAAVGAVRGYRVIIVMPNSMSIERRQLIAAYGAEIVLTPAALGMSGAVEKAEELAKKIPDSFIPGQFENPDNARAHYETTGPEIWQDLKEIDFFVAGVGTGGTITGAGRYLKEQNPALSVVAVEPAASALLSGKEAGKHGLQGIGANFIPALLDREIYDRIATVTEEAAFAAAKQLCRTEGILAGISSGAALAAAIAIAKEPANQGKSIVVVLPDTGTRYLSTGLFAEP